MSIQGKLNKALHLEEKLDETYTEIKKHLLKTTKNKTIQQFTKTWFEVRDSCDNFYNTLNEYIAYDFRKLDINQQIPKPILDSFWQSETTLLFDVDYHNVYNLKTLYLKIDLDKNGIIQTIETGAIDM